MRLVTDRDPTRAGSYWVVVSTDMVPPFVFKSVRTWNGDKWLEMAPSQRVVTWVEE